MVQAALQTGARYGELIRLRVEDFDAAAGTVTIRQSKAGKPQHVVLTEEGIALFGQLAAGRAGDEPMLRRHNGAPFGAAHQRRPMAEACRRAKITPPISFHILRHTWASCAITNGVPLLVAAKNLGHADTRMVELHYGSFGAELRRRCNPPRRAALRIPTEQRSAAQDRPVARVPCGRIKSPAGDDLTPEERWLIGKLREAGGWRELARGGPRELARWFKHIAKQPRGRPRGRNKYGAIDTYLLLRADYFFRLSRNGAGPKLSVTAALRQAVDEAWNDEAWNAIEDELTNAQRPTNRRSKKQTTNKEARLGARPQAVVSRLLRRLRVPHGS